VGSAPVRFTSDGGIRTIEFRGVASSLRDLKGLRYVERLVVEPGREFHVLDLVATESGTLRAPSRLVGDDDDNLVVQRGQAGLAVLDDVARNAYRRRLADIDDDIDEARAMNDPGRIELAERDREYLVTEITRSVGLGNRHRTTAGSPERARTSVTRSIRYSLRQLADVQPDLATHLQQCVRTGIYCRYEPDPLARLRWDITGR
jgi:hypothetical protein